eukprot:s2447_g2.t1
MFGSLDVHRLVTATGLLLLTLLRRTWRVPRHSLGQSLPSQGGDLKRSAASEKDLLHLVHSHPLVSVSKSQLQPSFSILRGIRSLNLPRGPYCQHPVSPWHGWWRNHQMPLLQTSDVRYGGAQAEKLSAVPLKIGRHSHALSVSWPSSR